MASTTAISVDLLRTHLIDISGAFDNVVHMLQAFAGSHGASRDTKKLSRAVMDAQQLSMELDLHITRNDNWQCAVYRLNQRGLGLLEETYHSLVSMSNKIEMDEIHESLLDVERSLKEACLLYLGEDVEHVGIVCREDIKDKLAAWDIGRR